MSRYEPISEDPDLVQAIEDFAGQVIEVRHLSAQAVTLPEGSAHRTDVERNIRGHMSSIDLRARRIGLTGAALFELINAAVDVKARRGRPAPSRDTSRTLITNVSNAHARLASAREAERLASAEVAEAIKHLAACEGAAAAWGAKGVSA